jgi:2-dehydro-3-deoxy-D-gluconate 5-dehydrogenase
VTSPPPPSVLVAGATSGIGQAITRGFAKAGEQVLAVGIGVIPPAEQNITYASLDVVDDAAVGTMISPLKNLRTVVNAAGVIRRQAEHDPVVFQQVIDGNLNGTTPVCEGARGSLAANKGAITNIASMLSVFWMAVLFRDTRFPKAASFSWRCRGRSRTHRKAFA